MNNRGVCLRLALVFVVALFGESYVKSFNVEHPLKVMPIYPFCNVNEVSIVVFPHEWCRFTSHQVSNVVGNIEVESMPGDGASYRVRATTNRPGRYGFYGALMNEGRMLLATDTPILVTAIMPILENEPTKYT